MVKSNTKSDLVVGIGSALVDILAYEDDEFLKKTGAEKGGMCLVDKDFIEQILSLVSGKTTTVEV